MYLLANGRLITRDPAKGYIKDGGVVIEGTKIKEIGATTELKAKYPGNKFTFKEKDVYFDKECERYMLKDA